MISAKYSMQTIALLKRLNMWYAFAGAFPLVWETFGGTLRPRRVDRLPGVFVFTGHRANDERDGAQQRKAGASMAAGRTQVIQVQISASLGAIGQSEN